jgi:conjugal transfer/entry exclusion protein
MMEAPVTTPTKPSDPAVLAAFGGEATQARVRRRARWGRLPCALLLSGSLVLRARVAEASIFGEENATLGAILGEDIAQLAEMIKTVAGIAAQIEQLKAIVQQGGQVLHGVSNPQGVLNLLNYAQNTLATLNRIDSDAKMLRYKLDGIDQDRKEVFPEMSSVPSSDVQQKAHNWNAALQESSKIAMRAQTSVQSLQQRMDGVTKLQNDSDAADGVVGQLQIVVRMLAVLHTDLAATELNIAAGQRVTASMAGIQAAEADRIEENNKRMLDNYTSRGATPRLLLELP